MEWKEPGLWGQADLGLPPLGHIWLGDFRRFTQLLGAGPMLGSEVQGAAVLFASRPAASIVRHTGVTWVEPEISPRLVPFAFYFLQGARARAIVRKSGRPRNFMAFM